MRQITLNIKENKFSSFLEFIKILDYVEVLELDSISLPGEPVSEEEFRKWVEQAESASTVSLSEAKQQWAIQKKNITIKTK